MESKEAIVERLHFTLLATRAGRDIAEMRYVREHDMEFVDITYAGGGIRRVNVTADSGLSMIYDIVEAIK